MICYVFWKENKIINCKIDNVSSILEDEIIGDTSCHFSDGSDYIILQSDTINKSIGENIDLTVLNDERTYFTKGKEIWLQEKLNKANDTIKTLSNDNELLKGCVMEMANIVYA